MFNMEKSSSFDRYFLHLHLLLCPCSSSRVFCHRHLFQMKITDESRQGQTPNDDFPFRSSLRYSELHAYTNYCLSNIDIRSFFDTYFDFTLLTMHMCLMKDCSLSLLILLRELLL